MRDEGSLSSLLVRKYHKKYDPRKVSHTHHISSRIFQDEKRVWVTLRIRTQGKDRRDGKTLTSDPGHANRSRKNTHSIFKLWETSNIISRNSQRQYVSFRSSVRYSFSWFSSLLYMIIFSRRKAFPGFSILCFWIFLILSRIGYTRDRILLFFTFYTTCKRSHFTIKKRIKR